MNATFSTALLLILILLLQSATAVAAALPCTPERMTASATADISGSMSDKMSDHAEHANHHADVRNAQVMQGAQTDKTDRPDCCKQMNIGICTAGGCAAGPGSAMTMLLLSPHLSMNQTDHLWPVQMTRHYGSPPSAIFRPPIS